MTPIPDIILKLQHAPTPDRNLDVEIGLAVGYTRTPHRGRNGKRSTVIWFLPTGEKTTLPFFTKSIDAARSLSLMLIPGCVGAFTWGEKFSSARINDGPRFAAASPSLALCAAALGAIYEHPSVNGDVNG